MADSSSLKLAAEVRKIYTFLREVHTAEQLSHHPVKVTVLSFVKGIAYGLGALTAAAIVTPFIVWFLQSVAWPPVIADFVTDVIHQMGPVSPRGQPTVDGL
ncbi:MAG: DUF5665 domain-containing protein [Candidatus Peribacteraceae bacterium]|nr:DUF5665 domain-containing protein [Candidatus Peribacteraceae bacterium]